MIDYNHNSHLTELFSAEFALEINTSLNLSSLNWCYSAPCVGWSCFPLSVYVKNSLWFEISTDFVYVDPFIIEVVVFAEPFYISIDSWFVDLPDCYEKVVLLLDWPHVNFVMLATLRHMCSKS